MEKNKKTVTLTVIGLVALLISIIGAAYAYYKIGVENNFGTPKIDASTAALGSVKLVSTDNNLYLNLTRTQMSKDKQGVYYATSNSDDAPIGKGVLLNDDQNEIDDEELEKLINPTIGYVEVTGSGYFDCSYEFEVTYEGNLKEILTENDKEKLKLGMKFFNGNPDYLDFSNEVNSIDYDVYGTEFPLTISGTLYDITSESRTYITASLSLDTSYEQDHLKNKNMKLSIKAKSFSCRAYNAVDSVNGDESVYAQVVNDVTNNNNAIRLTGSDKGSRNYNTYYYTGDALNNNILYGGFCWKMVLTTEGHGVKILYNGIPQTLDDGTISCDNTGDDSTIGKSEFNDISSLAGVGYMYNNVYTSARKYDLDDDDTVYTFGNSVNWNGTKYELVDTISGTWSNINENLNNNHYTCWNEDCTNVYYIYYGYDYAASYIILTDGVNINEAINEMLHVNDVNTKDSTVKTYIDSWYENNLLNREDSEGTKYSNYLENTIFCNNREINDLGSFNPNGGGVDNILKFQDDSLDCKNLNDQFTLRVDSGGKEGYGNNALKYPIGLLSNSEAWLPIRAIANPYYGYTYLYSGTGYFYWLLSSVESSHANFYVGSLGGRLYNNEIIFEYSPYMTATESSIGVRPVVSLSKNVKIVDGDGSYTNPYQVKLNK